MKLLQAIIIILHLGLISLSAQSESISFRYGFIAQGETIGDTLLTLDDRAELSTGDEVKLNIGFEKGTTCYIILLSSQNEYSLFYTSASHDYSKSEDNIFTTLPWFRLDKSTGEETFYLISSRTPLTEMEDLLDKYIKAKKQSRKRFHKRIEYVLKNLMPKQDSLNEGGLVARLDEPIIGGVTFRGKPDLIMLERALTHKCEGDNIAAATFRIVHK